MRSPRPASMTGFFIAILALMTLTCPLFGVSLAGDQGHLVFTKASWYSNVETKGKDCADGRFHDLSKEYVAASWYYPLGTRIRVTELIDRKVVEVTIVDRGPAKRLCALGRCLDLSQKSFSEIAPLARGVVEVSIEVVE